MVEDEKTNLYRPGGEDLHLLDDEDELGAANAPPNVLGRERVRVVGVDQIAARGGNDVDAGHQDSIGNLVESGQQDQTDWYPGIKRTMAKNMSMSSI